MQVFYRAGTRNYYYYKNQINNVLKPRRPGKYLILFWINRLIIIYIGILNIGWLVCRF